MNKTDFPPLELKNIFLTVEAKNKALSDDSSIVNKREKLLKGK